MKEYDFKLTPAYCLFNGIAVSGQCGSEITFVMEVDDVILKERVSRAFENYVKYVLRQNNCPEEFKKEIKVNFERGDRQRIRKCVSALYGENDDRAEATVKVDVEEKKNEAAAVLLLDTILNEARRKGATDVHIEKNLVLFRINGLLENEMEIGEEKFVQLIQRIKFLSGMNVLEKRKSQDGQFSYDEKSPLFVRVSSMAVIGDGKRKLSESVVLRLLDTNRVPLSLEKLGFCKNQLTRIGKLCEEKSGLVVVCGSTGAGKSTTAASILMEIRKLRKGCVKIVSLEDPPEYLIPGVSQIQIDENGQNPFDEALKHVFRQDPDVLMIGEIRDEKTAGIACRAALTGHLVIATLHTRGAAQSVLRLEDLGVPGKLIASVMKGVIVQELNHIRGVVSLIADVAVVTEKFRLLDLEDLSEDEMEETFVHYLNFGEAMEKSVWPYVIKEKKNAVIEA